VGLQCAVLRSMNRLLDESQEESVLNALDGCDFKTWPHLSAHKKHIMYKWKLESPSVAMVI